MSAEAIEPRDTGPDGTQRWADYLGWLRETVIAGVRGLSEEEQRHTRLPSGWTPIELLSHVLHMEQRWFVWGFLGERVDDPWGDWNRPEPWVDDDSDDTRPGTRWEVSPDVTAEDLARRLRRVGERTSAIIGEHPPTTRAADTGRFGDDPPTLEWICFHVLAEYARHAGHLDIVIELGRH